RHRSAPGRAIRGGSFRGDPEANGRAPKLRPRHRTRHPGLCPDDHRADLSVSACPLPYRDRTGGRNPGAWDDLVIPLKVETILTVFAVFCRVGGCLLIAPGFSSSYIPPRIRL